MKKKFCAFTFAETFNGGQDGMRSGGHEGKHVILKRELMERSQKNWKFRISLNLQATLNLKNYCINSHSMFQSDVSRWSEGRKARWQAKNQTSLREKRSFSWQSPAKVAAFTLAETLITLVIVGVVAALTIPNLIVKYQKEQTATKLKKVYSTIKQVEYKAIAENGPQSSWGFENIFSVNYEKKYEFFNKYYLKYMSQSKDCYHIKNCSKIGKRKYMNNDSDVYLYSNYPDSVTAILNDGTLFYLSIYGTFNFYVDINGDKGPNRFGRDVFTVFQTPYSFGGSINSSRETLKHKCKKDSRGTYCFALIAKDNWKISDDYPW